MSAISPTVYGQGVIMSNIRATAWSPDSRFLALALGDNTVRLWDAQENRLCALFRGHLLQVLSLVFTPDSKRLVSAGFDGTVRIWSLDTPVRDTLTDSLGIHLVPLRAGDFVMGTPPDAENRRGAAGNPVFAFERPLHWVRISQPFYMGQQEVTVKQFRTFVEAANYKTTSETNNRGGGHIVDARFNFVRKPEFTWRSPGFVQTDDHPVVQVSWADAQAFCRWLGEREGAVYRLPSEAEWEYACCGGGSWVPWNLRPLGMTLKKEDMFGNISDLSLKRETGRNDPSTDYEDGYPWTAPVGRLNINDFGLHDMYGNVYEWCADWYDPAYYHVSPPVDPQGPATGTHRVLRSGAWASPWYWSYASTRMQKEPPDQALSNVGFRVVREIAGGRMDRELPRPASPQNVR